ncbi:MAG: xanthine dehydrogenase family protein subunit M [Pseudodesulfovibrio sp.]|uniref:Molybdopterin dehydrogenase FAD-binding protein n=2 Tax=Pseudodesulfovibrio aespoeensis TaxID=182210 RepID=E6VRV1_PSEA9|nr:MULTISPECIES: xanthine dehydrogenase family protein subunit M [Pseudodesulfovibrio]MBU4191778.1 xanthine dehydrogenase family protein subunit M [Pseudomonadota bacterium]MCG2733109.1 xanthine dehydrogenase family protein subunit M [Pseudodesulfovibrio aespoeensis]ADU64238.1 molybdopterin dehydrogenase FAD-binding protein [Pseudodesulfovibrio aespoeensis Aspo-2]MBU4243018.1 xanthine dehydrogenase family protein subunit M [Pseudomonadota bacterium]MBU4380287.1 xanthine dehydrogenase family pr
MPMHLPTHMAEVLDMLAARPDARIMAGGTDLLVRLRASGQMPETLVCLERVAELRRIEALETVSGPAVRIGAATTITDLLRSDTVRARLPLLHRATTLFASPLVRNSATLGGNLCTASPAADTLPALYVLNASVELRSPRGTRILPIPHFIAGPGRTALEPGELLTGVIVPISRSFNVQHFEKVGQRQALAIAVVSLAALVALENGIVKEARFAWGSVGPTIVRSPEAEAVLRGKRLTLTGLRAAAQAARQAVSPISDLRASADYRREVAGNLLLRLATLSG